MNRFFAGRQLSVGGKQNDSNKCMTVGGIEYLVSGTQYEQSKTEHTTSKIASSYLDPVRPLTDRNDTSFVFCLTSYV
ncbi:MAG: hypothetical protein AAFX87_05520 [Bacteroidota bacterium]